MQVGLERGLEQGLEQGVILGLEKGILGVYRFEKNPDKIAEVLEKDKELVYKIFDKLKKEKIIKKDNLREKLEKQILFLLFRSNPKNILKKKLLKSQLI